MNFSLKGWYPTFRIDLKVYRYAQALIIAALQRRFVIINIIAGIILVPLQRHLHLLKRQYFKYRVLLKIASAQERHTIDL